MIDYYSKDYGRSCEVLKFAVENITAVSDYLRSEQLLLFASVRWDYNSLDCLIC